MCCVITTDRHGPSQGSKAAPMNDYDFVTKEFISAVMICSFAVVVVVGLAVGVLWWLTTPLPFLDLLMMGR